MESDCDDVYVELADMYISGEIGAVDENKAIMVLEKVKNKDKENYIKIDEKINKYIREKSAI